MLSFRINAAKCDEPEIPAFLAKGRDDVSSLLPEAIRRAGLALINSLIDRAKWVA
jgi:hypothetical protein